VTDLDQRLLFWLYGAPPGSPTLWLWAALTILGSGWSVVGLVPLALVRRTRAFAEWMAAALGTNGALVFVLKALLGRARPCRALPAVKALVFAAPTDCSLPSGHAAGAFCFAAFVVACAWRAGMPRRRVVTMAAVLGLFATGVALSRVALGVHWPADVTAGALLGSLLGALFGARAPWPAPRGAA
jgi:undecaprenyl-diphosphatase